MSPTEQKTDADRIQKLAARIQRLEDIKLIERLQRLYGYYLDNHMKQAVIDLFSDNTESIEVSDHGVFLGKKGVEALFNGMFGGGGPPPPGARPRVGGGPGIVMQYQGVVDVNPDGNTAKGRWQAVELSGRPVMAIPTPMWGLGIYENEYIKEDGQWFFKKLHYNQTFLCSYKDGWLLTPFVVPPGIEPRTKPDLPSTAFKPYHTGYRVPYYFQHPVTGE